MKLMKKKTRKQLQKMMRKGFEPAGFLTGAATALAVTAVLRSKSMHNLEHKVGEKLGEAWPKISGGMTNAANGILSALHLGGHNGHGKSEMKSEQMNKPEESEGFSAPSPRATRPGRSSRRESKE